MFRFNDGSRRAGMLVAALASAWAVPTLLHLAHADFLSPLLLWLAVASVLRTGGTMLDRLVPALGLLVSGVLIAGLVTTFWPWGLEPVPIAGSGLSLVVVVAGVTGRRPQLPRRLLGSDLLLVAGGAGAAAVAVLPRLGTRGLDWAAYGFVNGDRVRHVNLFDTILRIGGYPALNPGEASTALEPAMLRQYPAGAHFLYATVDSFVTGGDPGTALAGANHYFWYASAAFGLFTFTVAWAARRVAGPQIAGWRRAALVAGICGFLGTGFYTTMLWEGFDSQILGMALLALLIAVLARPPRRAPEQFLLVGALTVAITYTYTLFAAPAAIAIVAAAVLSWPRVRRHPWWAITMAAGFGAVAAIQPLIWYLREFKGAEHLNTDGFIMPLPTSVLVGLTVVAALGVAAPVRRRSPRLRTLAVLGLGGWGLTVVLFAYNMATVGHQSYYFRKLPQVLGIILLVTAGTALARLPRFRPRAGWRSRAACAVAAGVALILSGAVPYGTVKFDPAGHLIAADTTWGQVWATGRIGAPVGDLLTALAERGMLADGVHTVVFYSPDGPQNKHASLILGALNRDLGVTAPQAYATKGEDLVGHDGPLPASHKGLVAFLACLDRLTIPLRVVVGDERLAEALNAYATTHPAVSVVRIPGLPGPSGPGG
ncbi:hypothetical protein [Phytomonospora endophytica]|uniref:Glycosyltransferase RgtA/B/C/D-like domain-containing protein n=1 Tax=Phytomonospora endophytica TaxID=714109 RepID=A0A841FG27_9ACTN|nr:hypothetical protein [Phytomonospora endophytica]MBB6036281.1 hypothetical protein [Phytomonospora endophytica]GIG67188.1 hypothetical protein Pen01_34830 [Phytomonospora endophytica]